MIVFAHLGHWYSAFGFLVPAVLVVVWIRYQSRREARRQEFSQYWTLELRVGVWRLMAVGPAPQSRRQFRSRLELTPPPWSDPGERDRRPAYVYELMTQAADREEP
jgi:hypothetical protein